MKSKFASSTAALLFSILFMMTAAFTACAQGPGAPPSDATGPGGAPPAGVDTANVVKDTTPIPESGIVSITFLGNTQFTSDQLLNAIDGSGVVLGAKPGPDIIGPAMGKLVDFYRNNGADLSASPNIIEDPKGITFVQFLIDENGTKGDVGGLVSSGGVHIFY